MKFKIRLNIPCIKMKKQEKNIYNKCIYCTNDIICNCTPCCKCNRIAFKLYAMAKKGPDEILYYKCFACEYVEAIGK